MNKNYGTDIKKALFLTSPQKMKPFHPSKPSKKKKRKAGREHPWNMEPKEKEEDIGVERERGKLDPVGRGVGIGCWEARR